MEGWCRAAAHGPNPGDLRDPGDPRMSSQPLIPFEAVLKKSCMRHPNKPVCMYLRHKNRGSLFIENRTCNFGGKKPAGAPLVAPSLKSTCFMSSRHKHQDSLFSRNIISYLEKAILHFGNMSLQQHFTSAQFHFGTISLRQSVTSATSHFSHNYLRQQLTLAKLILSTFMLAISFRQTFTLAKFHFGKCSLQQVFTSAKNEFGKTLRVLTLGLPLYLLVVRCY